MSDSLTYTPQEHFALVVQSQRRFGAVKGSSTTSTVVCGVVSRIDLLRYISKEQPAEEQ